MSYAPLYLACKSEDDMVVCYCLNYVHPIQHHCVFTSIIYSLLRVLIASKRCTQQWLSSFPAVLRFACFETRHFTTIPSNHVSSGLTYNAGKSPLSPA